MITVNDLQGHWRRDWIKAPGFEDHSTHVHWMQAGALFADLRIPIDRPDIAKRTCLADLSPAELAQLMQSEGFAGTIDVTDSRCTWRREINWHGLPDADDIGLMYFQDGALIEDGVLAEYRERWVLEPGSDLRGHRIERPGMTGVLVENDTVFLVGMGPAPLTASKGVTSSLQNGDSAGARDHFASTYCLGHWDGSAGIATLSTNPFCEGTIVLQRGERFTWNAPSFDGEIVSVPLMTPRPNET